MTQKWITSVYHLHSFNFISAILTLSTSTPPSSIYLSSPFDNSASVKGRNPQEEPTDEQLKGDHKPFSRTADPLPAARPSTFRSSTITTSTASLALTTLFFHGISAMTFFPWANYGNPRERCAPPLLILHGPLLDVALCNYYWTLSQAEIKPERNSRGSLETGDDYLPC